MAPRFRRQAAGGGDVQSSPAPGSKSGIIGEIDRDVHLLADKTGMKTWQVFAIIAVILLVAVFFVAWCGWRFMRKKRKAKADAKAATDAKDDEDALVGNEEEDIAADADGKKETEYLGKLQYELKYDFNTQTLIVKVIQGSELPAMDMGGVSGKPTLTKFKS